MSRFRRNSTLSAVAGVDPSEIARRAQFERGFHLRPLGALFRRFGFHRGVIVASRANLAFPRRAVAEWGRSRLMSKRSLRTAMGCKLRLRRDSLRDRPPALLAIAGSGRSVIPAHQLVAPNSIRSDAMDLLLLRVRDGELSEDAALDLHERITEVRMRLLGDRVSRRTAWRIARDHDVRDDARSRVPRGSRSCKPTR